MMNQANSLVSIIIPTYNRAKKTKATILNLLNQSYNNIEIIVVDDGSIDNTKEVIEKMIDGKKIKYFYQSNAGPSSARNYGLRKSKGEYIVFFDSDDEMYPERIQKQVETMEKHSANICCAGIIYKKRNKTIIPPDIVDEAPLFMYLKPKNNIKIGTQAWMYRREILGESPYNERLRSYEDAELLLNIFSGNIKLVTVPEILTIYDDSDTEDRLTNHKYAYDKYLLEGLQVYYMHIFALFRERKVTLLTQLYHYNLLTRIIVKIKKKTNSTAYEQIRNILLKSFDDHKFIMPLILNFHCWCYQILYSFYLIIKGK